MKGNIYLINIKKMKMQRVFISETKTMFEIGNSAVDLKI